MKALRPQHQRYSHQLIFVVLSTKKRLPFQEKPRKHAAHPVTDSQKHERAAGRRFARIHRFKKASVIWETVATNGTNAASMVTVRLQACSNPKINLNRNKSACSFSPTGQHGLAVSKMFSGQGLANPSTTHLAFYLAIPMPHHLKSRLLAVARRCFDWTSLFLLYGGCQCRPKQVPEHSHSTDIESPRCALHDFQRTTKRHMGGSLARRNAGDKEANVWCCLSPSNEFA